MMKNQLKDEVVFERFYDSDNEIDYEEDDDYDYGTYGFESGYPYEEDPDYYWGYN